MATPLGKSITRTWMTGKEQQAQILFPTTEIGGSINIAIKLRADTANNMEPTIQPTIIHLKQANGTRHGERNHLPIGILNSGIDVPRSGRNIDNHIGMNPQGPIVTTIPESNRANNCDILNSVSKTSDITYTSSPCHDTIKYEDENLVENLRDNKNFKNAERKKSSKVEKVGRKNSVNWNHTNSILNWNKKYSKLIHIDTNHTDSIQPILDNLTNTVSIHDSANILAIENILALLVHSLVPASPIFLYRNATYPPSLSLDA